MKFLYIKTDSRNRISLTKLSKKMAPIYRAYIEKNKIILEPVQEVPQEEAWLFLPENKQLLARIKESLTQKADIDLGSFKKYLPKK